MIQSQLIHVLYVFFFIGCTKTEDPDLKKGDPVIISKNLNAPINEHVSVISHFLECCALVF